MTEHEKFRARRKAVVRSLFARAMEGDFDAEAQLRRFPLDVIAEVADEIMEET